MLRLGQLVATGVVSCLALSLHPGATEVPQQVTFRASIDYVQIDVAVTDKNGAPVRDLLKTDFHITESGRVQDIVDFEHVAVAPVRRDLTNLAASLPVVDVVSNARVPGGRQWVLVIDDLHITEMFIVHTQNVVKEFLAALPAKDHVAVVFVGRSDLSLGFTDDLGSLLRTVPRIRDAFGFAPDAADDLDARSRFRMAGATADVLRNVASSLARSEYPRKAVVYIGEGMTYRPDSSFYGNRLSPPQDVVYARDVFEQMNSALGRLRRSGVPVYAIDPRGIADCNAVRGPCSIPPYGNLRAQVTQLRQIAESTGGLALVNRGDMTQAVKQIHEDNGSYYLLGYYPLPFARDGRFHEVKVSVRRPGLSVRARAGYDAPSAKIDKGKTRETLEEALTAALPTANLALQGFAAPVATSPRGMLTAVTLEVAYPSLPGAATLDDVLQYGLVAVDPEGRVKATIRKSYRFSGKSAGLGGVTYAINQMVDLPSEALTLRLAVASETLGRAGTIHIPIEVIDPSRRSLQVGSVVLGFDGAPRQAAVPPGALQEWLPFQPTTARSFEGTDQVRIFVPMFWKSDNDTIVMTVSARGATDVELVRESIQGVATGTGTKYAVLQSVFSIGSLPKGPYVLEVRGLLGDTKSEARRALSFSVR
jgi:VWFA-related protein